MQGVSFRCLQLQASSFFSSAATLSVSTLLVMESPRMEIFLPLFTPLRKDARQ